MILVIIALLLFLKHPTFSHPYQGNNIISMHKLITYRDWSESGIVEINKRLELTPIKLKNWILPKKLIEVHYYLF